MLANSSTLFRPQDLMLYRNDNVMNKQVENHGFKTE
jgi:hypothetical protein